MCMCANAFTSSSVVEIVVHSYGRSEWVLKIKVNVSSAKVPSRQALLAD